MSTFDYIIKVCGKEILEEEDNIKQITLAILSAWTKNPQNVRILAQSGEGKTYLVTKCAELYPKENIIILAKASTQSFKYNFGSRKEVENGSGNWQDYDVAITCIDEELSNKKISPEKEKELQKARRELIDSTVDVIDFSNKVIILVDDQSYEFFESIKTTLSHDQENILSFSVNKSKSGTIQGQKFLFRGFPAVIYCSAKDEQKRDVTNEIGTRFNTISLNASSKKYREMLKLEGLRASLPKFIRDEIIISDEEKEQVQKKVLELIGKIKNNDEIINPYGSEISKLFKDDAGFRTRQLKILNNNIKVLTLAHSDTRPVIIYDGCKIPISTRQDIEEASSLTKEQKEIHGYKIKYFNDYIKPAILEQGKEQSLVTGITKGLTASGLVNVLAQKEIIVDRQRLQETILKSLSEHGFLEFFRDPDNKGRHIYVISERYLEKDASIESTLIDTSLLDTSCIKSFVKKYLEQRFNQGELELEDENGKNITPIELIEILCKIDAKTLKNRHKIGIIEASKNIEGEEN